VQETAKIAAGTDAVVRVRDASVWSEFCPCYDVNDFIRPDSFFELFSIFISRFEVQLLVRCLVCSCFER
jgi:hypothetical protein